MKNFLLTILGSLVLLSCSKKDPEPPVTIDATTLDLKYDKTHQFALTKGTESVAASGFTWKSSDAKIGTIDASGNFKARKIGETKITGTSTSMGLVESTIKISPYTTFITEPVIQFGTDVATIKSKEKRKLVQETAAGLVYEGASTSVRFVIYLLETGKVTGTALLLEGSNAVFTESVTFFKERYPNIDASDTEVYLLNDEETYEIILYIDADLGFIAEYIPYKKGGRLNGATNLRLNKSIRKLLGK